MPNLNTKIVSNIPVRLPKEKEIPGIVRALDSLEQSVNLIQAHLDKSKSLEHRLINDLIPQMT